MAKLFLLVLLFAVSVKCTSKCYYPDGTIEPDHVPCNQTTTGFSACCDHIDSCTLSGICRGASGWDYRGSCTDSAWNSANCAATQWNQCIIDPSTDERYTTYTPIWSCSPEGTGFSTDEWCCAYSNQSSCCASKFKLGITGIAFQPGFDIFVQNLTQSLTVTSTNSSGNTSAPSTSAAAETNGDIGTKVGLGVGIPLGFLVAGVLGFLFWKELRKNRNTVHFSQQSPSQTPMIRNAAVVGYSGSFHAQSAVENGYKSPHNQNVAATPATYEPSVKKMVYSQPAPVYEPARNDVHEMSATR